MGNIKAALRLVRRLAYTSVRVLFIFPKLGNVERFAAEGNLRGGYQLLILRNKRVFALQISDNRRRKGFEHHLHVYEQKLAVFFFQLSDKIALIQCKHEFLKLFLKHRLILIVEGFFRFVKFVGSIY